MPDDTDPDSHAQAVAADTTIGERTAARALLARANPPGTWDAHPRENYDWDAWCVNARSHHGDNQTTIIPEIGSDNALAIVAAMNNILPAFDQIDRLDGFERDVADLRATLADVARGSRRAIADVAALLDVLDPGRAGAVGPEAPADPQAVRDRATQIYVAAHFGDGADVVCGVCPVCVLAGRDVPAPLDQLNAISAQPNDDDDLDLDDLLGDIGSAVMGATDEDTVTRAAASLAQEIRWLRSQRADLRGRLAAVDVALDEAMPARSRNRPAAFYVRHLAAAPFDAFDVGTLYGNACQAIADGRLAEVPADVLNSMYPRYYDRLGALTGAGNALADATRAYNEAEARRREHR